MKYLGWVLLATLNLSCGYKLVTWPSSESLTLAIRPVSSASDETRAMRVRMRDLMIERCLAGSGLIPVDEGGALTLSGHLKAYRENVVATDIDGRTSRIQFTLQASFELHDDEGTRLWFLDNYRYSDQYSISTTRSEYRNETVFVQDTALRNIADLVITNITLTLAELKRDNG